jgi:hypothetical protein
VRGGGVMVAGEGTSRRRGSRVWATVGEGLGRVQANAEKTAWYNTMGTIRNVEELEQRGDVIVRAFLGEDLYYLGIVSKVHIILTASFKQI